MARIATRALASFFLILGAGADAAASAVKTVYTCQATGGGSEWVEGSWQPALFTAPVEFRVSEVPGGTWVAAFLAPDGWRHFDGAPAPTAGALYVAGSAYPGVSFVMNPANRRFAYHSAQAWLEGGDAPARLLTGECVAGES
ncbi:MAG: hypothetical protein KF823_01085 [Xanthomonadales bacterium]|nr:hypothetical protein [Xanthomonadales bacterium]